MNRKLSKLPAVAVVLLAGAAALWAHHGTGVSYDQSKSFVQKAVVTEFHYLNPHPSIYFDVKDEKGNVVHWSGEIGPNAAQLQQNGWGRKRSEAALPPGTEVELTIAPSRAGTPVGLINKIVNSKGENVMGMGGDAFNPVPSGPGRGKQ